MGKMQRVKGCTYERVLATKFRPLYPEARRGIGQARSAKEVSDVDGTPWWVEAKHQQCPNIWAAMAQAVAATDGRPPLVVAKRNGGVELAVMRLDDFIEVLDELKVQRAEGARLTKLLSGAYRQGFDDSKVEV